MFFRRLSERLIVECGEIAELPIAKHFVALYVNANDFGDAFAHFPEHPSPEDERRLTCYANLCILSDLLTVQSARAGRKEPATDRLLSLVQSWLVPPAFNPLIVGEDRLGRYRAVLEQTKWAFARQGRTNSIQLEMRGGTRSCRPRAGMWPPISSTKTGNVRTSPTQNRRVMSTSSRFGPTSTVAVTGSSVIPQIGQLPGPTWRICGCIGHV